MWVNSDEYNGTSGVDDDGNGYIDDIYGIDAYNGDADPIDDHGHGTHCSGTIGAEGDNGLGVAGVNWNVKIMALKFLSGGGSGSTSGAIECLEYVIDMRERGENIRVTSNSWGGGGFSQSLFNAITLLGEHDVLFVAAAGNSSSDNDSYPHYPSSYECSNIIAVAATDHSDNMASFSSYGATSVDVGAPGVNILSSLPGYVDYIPAPGDFFYDDVESGSGNWIAESPWDTTDERASSGSYSWTDSPDGEYEDYTDVSLTSEIFDLSSQVGQSLYLGFSGWIDLEYYYDYLYIEVSGDGGSTWEEIGEITGHNTSWSVYSYIIPQSVLTAQFQFRLRMVSDYIFTYDGVYIDNIGIGLGNSVPDEFFYDDVESGTGGWSGDDPWDTTNSKAYSGSYSWTDSPGGSYENNVESSLTSETIDLGGQSDQYIILGFNLWLDLESYYDRLHIEASGDNGSTWTQIGYLSGHNTQWLYYSYYIPPSLRTSQFKFRFRLDTDYSITYDGV